MQGGVVGGGEVQYCRKRLDSEKGRAPSLLELAIFNAAFPTRNNA